MVESISPYSIADVPIPQPSAEVASEVRIEYCAELLEHFFSKIPGGKIISDIDGVIYQQNGLENPTPTSNAVFGGMKAMEERGVAIGVASSRGTSVVDQLRRDGLQILGHSILEEGQLLLVGDDIQYIASERYVNFAEISLSMLKSHPRVVDAWSVLEGTEMDGQPLCFYHGDDSQWRGDLRIAPWFSMTATNEHGKQHSDGDAKNLMREIISEAQEAADLVEGKDFDLYVGRMGGVRPVGHVRMLGRTAGREVISKATGIQILPDRYIFVADGYRDWEAGREVSNRGGLVVSILGNLDISTEPHTFHNEAAIVLHNPDEWAQVLLKTADKL